MPAGANAAPRPRMDASEYRDEVENESVRRRMENVARAATGRPLRVRFGDGASTDLAGVVQVDPRCRFLFGEDAADGGGSPSDRLVMIRGLLEHELCHELYYDRAVFREMNEEIRADRDKAPLARLSNILADCRDEHRHRAFQPNSYGLIAAMDALWREKNGTGRWSFGEESSVRDEVEGALLYRGLPGYALDEGLLSDEALEVYRECRPHLDRAVKGTSADVLAGAREILAVLADRGLLDGEDSREPFGDSGTGWPFGDARGSLRPSGDEGPLPADAAEAYEAEDAPQDGPAGGCGPPTGGGEEGDAAACPENGAADALEEARRECGGWARAAREAAPREPVYADASEEVCREDGDAPHLSQRRLWAENAQNQKRFAKQISAARVVASAPERFKKSGKLDRRRRRALAVGAEDVFVGRGRSLALSVAAEIVLDVSASMEDSLPALRASAATLSGGLDLAGIAHEIRGFSDHDALPLYRAFGEAPDWRLGAVETVNGTDLWAVLPRVRARLGARGEEAKVAVILTDGATTEPEMARREIAALRRCGVVVVGAFLRDPDRRVPPIEAQMDALFDGGVAYVDDPMALPALVGGKIASMIAAGPGRAA